MINDFYQTLHSPRGAFAHFALGLHGSGGFGLQADRAAANDVFIGYKRGNQIVCLPFYRNAVSAELATFQGEQTRPAQLSVQAFPAELVQRRFGRGIDSWEAPGIRFTLYTPVTGIPDPGIAPPAALKDALAPALAARLEIDNRDGAEAVQGFFAVNGLRGLRLLDEETGGALSGWAAVQGYGFACRGGEARAVSQWDLPSLFTPPGPLAFRLGGMGALLVDVPTGGRITLDIALGWYQGGPVTHGLHRCTYYYTRYFSGLEDVLAYAVERMPAWRTEAEVADRALQESRLNPDQRFMLAQSERSYDASSMLFDDGGKPRWVVNEGSFVMINTFDLAVDHLFYELDRHPWTVRNTLDSFADDYAYYDQVRFPGEERLNPGGVSFTHDQGSFNTFTPRGYSSYEISGQPGCYSYMTQEQLVNWLVCAGLYARQSGDDAWLVRRRGLIGDCLRSMQNRDHPNPAHRDGIMDLDSSRCGASSEITTYDSLDPSLGQARRNLYLAVKCWAAYLALEWMFGRLDEGELAAEASSAARLCANTIASAYDPGLGYIPAILDGKDQSPIIPAVEGLVFSYRMGLHDALRPDGPYAAMISRLRDHLLGVLKPGVCLFPDGSWRLSARSENSWISKVFLCQYVARQVLGIDFGAEQVSQDRAHANWWRVGSAPNPAIDQIFAGKTSEVGFYYPRAVTSSLWLDEE
jgi:hypothetical protein